LSQHQQATLERLLGQRDRLGVLLLLLELLLLLLLLLLLESLALQGGQRALLLLAGPARHSRQTVRRLASGSSSGAATSGARLLRIRGASGGVAGVPLGAAGANLRPTWPINQRRPLISGARRVGVLATQHGPTETAHSPRPEAGQRGPSCQGWPAGAHRPAWGRQGSLRRGARRLGPARMAPAGRWLPEGAGEEAEIR